MRMKKWVIAPFMASMLCAACNSGNQASVSGGQETAAQLASYDPEKIELAKKSNCFSCHAIEKKMIGPSLKDVAAKYRGDAGAEDKLATRVSRGSSGTWGSIPMPANSPAVSDADIQTLVKFTLSLK